MHVLISYKAWEQFYNSNIFLFKCKKKLAAILCCQKKNIFQVEFSENYQWFWLGAIVGLSIFGCINYKIVIIIRWQYWIIFIGIEIRFRGPKRRFTIEIINQSFGKCQFFRFISFVKNMSRMRHIFQMTIQVKDMALSLFF